MNVRTFIDRPILSGVISVVILILGSIALLQLPLEQFPDIAPPTVSVMANYTGASAETVLKSVVVPLEESINGVENMMYMTSNATNSGQANINIFFKQGTDPDMSVVNVQNRVAEAQRLLPAEVTKAGITIRKRQTSTLMYVSLYSPDDSFQANFLTNYMQINVEPRLIRIPGVGEVSVFGARYSMRIWLDPGKMAMYSLVPSDIAQVLEQQNIESPTGKLGSETENVFVYTLNYRGRYEKEEDYGNMVIKSLPDGRILRLKDVAEIELGSQQYNFFNEVDGHPSCNCMIVQTPGSNANEVIKQVEAVFKDVEKDLPSGMKLVTIMSVKDFLDASILEVIKTLALAILLVILVVYLFLHDFRATMIPSIAIIVSLIGTFAFIYAAGFSLNLITLFALVLVIGTVVDDSIVVVEAVQARFDSGYRSAYKATVDAMGGLTSAIVTNTLVFMAVFIPVCFMGGTTGIFYTQFGLTMAVAVGISCINSLTLSPALSAIMMRPRIDVPNGGRNGFFSRFQTRYAFAELKFFKHKWISWVLIVAAVGGLGWMLATTKTGLVPQEDMGSISVNVQAAPGTNLEQTERILEEVEEIIRDIPQVRIYSRTAGRDSRGTTTMAAGSFNLRLKHWNERKKKEDGVDAVMEEIYRRTAHISAATIRLSTRPMISGYGSGSGFELYVQDRKGGNVEDLLKYTRQMISALNQRPEISRAFTSFDTKYPQYIVDVDAALCIRNGLAPTDVLSAISGYVGGDYVSNFNRFTKLFRVMVQASPEYRTSPEDFNNIYVRNSSGQMSPVSEYIRLTKVYGAEALSRFNLFPSIAVFGENAQGHSSGQAIRAIREVASEVLPEGYGFEFGGMSREESETGNTTIIVFAICLIFIYLILCALYESLMIPLAIILSVPIGLAGSLLFAKLWGLENNIYLQIGLIMLIGLLSKTAVLLTEYGVQARKAGMSITQAAMSAAKDRLRPILMTSLTMIIGLLPLVFSSGVGANGNISVGVGAAGGMLVGTLAILFVTPVLFIIFQYLQERHMPNRILVLIPLLVIFSSCGVYGSYSREAAGIEEGTGVTKSSLPSWRSVFTDAPLQALVDTALRYNTDLQVALLRTAEARSALRSARLAFLPSFGVNASVAVPGGDASADGYASWIPDIFGKQLNASRKAEAGLEESEAFARAVRTEVIAAVADAYYTLITLDAQLAISEQTLLNWEKTIGVLESLKLAGKTNDVAILQAKAKKLNLESSSMSLKGSIAITRNAICTLLGKDIGEIVRSAPDAPLPEIPQTGISLSSIASRPDVAQAEAVLKQAFYGTQAARSDLFPDITLSGTLGWTSASGTITDPASWLASALASLTAPVFEHGKRRSALEIAKSRQEEARLQYVQTLLRAGNEVNDALTNCQTARDRIEIDTRQQTDLGEAVEKIELMMRYSTTNYLEVLTAQQSFLDAEIKVVEDRLALARGVISLFRATGSFSKD